MMRQCMAPMAPTDAALAAIERASNRLPRVLLHSGRYHRRWASRSILAVPKVWFRFTAGQGSRLFDAESGRPVNATRPLTGRLFGDLDALLQDRRFPGRWFGYFSYDVGRLIEPGKLAALPTGEGDWPLVELGWCPDAAEFVVAEGPGDRGTEGPKGGDSMHGPSPTSNFTRAEYERAVRRVLEYIAAGDVFQVNLSQRFTSRFAGDALALYRRLTAGSPAWYGAYVELPGPERRALLSTSPELFLEWSGGLVTTRPIKGTRPVTADPEELRNSDKDAAELNMIIDLMRNDLGRVCDYGSVRVAEARAIETHPTVHHGVATVTGRLHRGKSAVDLLKATLPGGSVTGAPKVRAMQIIDELEPVRRGPYCGCIGYVARDEVCLNLAIRTMATRADAAGGTHVCFGVGGGIVADSDPTAEYDETLTKAKAMMRALGHER